MARQFRQVHKFEMKDTLSLWSRRLTFSIAFSLFLVRLKTTVWRTETSSFSRTNFKELSTGKQEITTLIWFEPQDDNEYKTKDVSEVDSELEKYAGI